MRFSFALVAIALAASTAASAAERVPVGSFRSIELRGGGSINLVPGSSQRVTIVEGSSAFTTFAVDRNGRLRINACNRRCPQQYKLRIQVQSPRVPDLAVSGGGQIRLGTGFAPQAQLAAAVNGGGSVDTRAVAARNVSAAVNGGGQVLVRSTAILSAAVRGGGSIRYVGNPQVSTAIMGGGSVSPVR